MLKGQVADDLQIKSGFFSFSQKTTKIYENLALKKTIHNPSAVVDVDVGVGKTNVDIFWIGSRQKAEMKIPERA